MINSVLNIIRDRKRVKKILKECGCCCYCPECNEPLNDKSDTKMIDKDGIYQYTCSKCGFKSVFHFGISPAPIYLEDYKVK